MESPFSLGLSQRPEEDWGEWDPRRAGRLGVLGAAPVGDRCGRTCGRPRSVGAGGGRLGPPGPAMTAGVPVPRPGSPRGSSAVPRAEGGVGGPRRAAGGGCRPPARRSRAPRAPTPTAPGRSPPLCFGPSVCLGGREGRRGRASPLPHCRTSESRSPGASWDRGTRGAPSRGAPAPSAALAFAGNAGGSSSSRFGPSASVAGAASRFRLVNGSPRLIFQGQKFF